MCVSAGRLRKMCADDQHRLVQFEDAAVHFKGFKQFAAVHPIGLRYPIHSDRNVVERHPNYRRTSFTFYRRYALHATILNVTTFPTKVDSVLDLARLPWFSVVDGQRHRALIHGLQPIQAAPGPIKRRR